MSFNSLQTGKPIQSTRITLILCLTSMSFNSLQTGKPIQSAMAMDMSTWGISKFQFPSNGKAYPKPKGPGIASTASTKSPKFQFPSNGKAYPKYSYRIRWNSTVGEVSIPFKRESLSKALWRQSRQRSLFVSIPFKRESLSKVERIKRSRRRE